jgi:hypothetical protein
MTPKEQNETIQVSLLLLAAQIVTVILLSMGYLI